MDNVELKDENEVRTKVRDLAEGLILVLQGNMMLDPAVAVINDTVAIAGIKAKYGQQGRQAWWDDDTQDGSEVNKAQALMSDIKKCWPQGEFEREASMVEATIWRHRRTNMGDKA